MKANLHARTEHAGNDEGVSPVIAVILMVAITVVLAATVYVWVSGFASDEQGSENAQVRASGFDASNNGATDWIRLTLVSGENAPYDESVVDLQGLDHNNAALTLLCETVAWTDPNCDEPFASPDTWAVGEVLYIPCQGEGQHQLTLTIRNSVILDDRIRCNEVAP